MSGSPTLDRVAGVLPAGPGGQLGALDEQSPTARAVAAAVPTATVSSRAVRARWFARRPGLLLSITVIVVVFAWALVPGWFTSHDPINGVPRDQFIAPGARHWFGTDNIGRDLYSRVVHGAAYSLRAVAVALAIALVLGALIGLLSGYLGGWVDTLLMRAVDVVLAVPTLLISLILITALGFGTLNVSIAVGAAAVASFSRVTRSEVIRVRSAAYVEAAINGGVRWYTVVWRHVLPNSSGPLIALTTLEFGSAILAISALNFLGFGAAPPAPEWGGLVAGGRNYLATSWWITTLPGVVIIAVVLAANRISRAFDGEWRRFQ